MISAPVIRLAHNCVCVLLASIVISILPSPSFGLDTMMIVNNPVRQAGVVVLDATAPTFSAELGRLLGPEAIEKAPSLLPYSLIVINDSGQYIWGFTVVYRYPNRIAPSGNVSTHRISPSAGGPAHTSRMMAPGGTYLITPVSGFLASTGAGGKRTLQPLLGGEMDRVLEHFRSTHKDPSERIEVTIDSVIFEDGSLVGPDAERMLFNINDRVRAEKDLSKAVQGLRGSALVSTIQQHARDADDEEYGRRVRGVANALLDVITSKGEESALSVIDAMRAKQWFTGSDLVRRRNEAQ